MARRYSRDNKGRFASSGTGATARGGRLKTASGKTRETKKRIISSKESRKTGPKAFAASAESGRVNMPVKFGGEGQGYKTPRGKAAAAKSRAADAANKAAKRRSGLPASGGAMRVKGGLKRNPGAAAKMSKAKASAPKATTKPLTGRQRRGELSQVQSDKLVMAKANLSLAKAGLAGSRENKARAKNALEKLKATESINNNQTRIRNAERTITSVNARAIPGRPINGRIGETMRSAGAKRTGAIKGSVPRNAGAASKVKAGTNLNAGKYKNIYINNANQKGKAAAKATTKPRTQKERWASRSAMLSTAAAKNEAKAKRMFDATTKTDTAFNTQPGRLPGRARMNAQTERSFKLQEKAAQQRSRAANLERMANTNKGDAAKRRATRADVIKDSHKGLKKGDTVEGVLYGAREVVKVNAKSVTVKGGVKNFTIPWEQIKPKQ
jgi:hypothetical protein